MHIEAIETVERVFEIELEWDELYKKDPHAHIYLSSAFISAVTIRTAGKFRILVVWSDEGQCIGILPLFVATRWSKAGNCLYNVFDMLGHAFDSDYTGILCDPDCDIAVCEALAAKVCAMDFGRIILNYFNGPVERLNAFRKGFSKEIFDQRDNEHFINDGQTNNLICPYVDLPASFEDYLTGLSSNSRQKLRRLLRQLDSDASLRITRSRPETYTQDVTILSKLWYLKHVEQKGQKQTTKLADLFKEVVMLGLAAGMVHLAILWRDGKPIAAQANYIDHLKRQSLFHVGGRDERVRDVSAGLMLQAYCIRWAIAAGLKRYDFTIGNEPYKYSLGASEKQIVSAEISTKSGTNVTGQLDPIAREEVVKIIDSFVAKGRDQEAETTAKQALAVWPDFSMNGKASSIIKRLRNG